LILVGRNLGVRRWPLAWAIYIPDALPAILTGLKIAWAFGWRTLIAAELVFGVIGGKGGLGLLHLSKALLFRDGRHVCGAGDDHPE